MKKSNGIELFVFIIGKAWKMIFKNEWEPVAGRTLRSERGC